MMDVLRDNAVAMILILVAVAVFVVAIQFRKFRPMMAGESISPKWFGLVRWIGIIGAVVLLLSQGSSFAKFMSTDVLRVSQDTDALMGTVVYAVLVVVVIAVTSAFAKKIPEKWWIETTTKMFDEDKVCQYLLKDAEAGAKEILLFRDRLEGRRSYSFDVDAYDRASFSADGCRMLAKYIDKHYPNVYEIEECHSAPGQGSGALNVEQARFSHMKLTRKN